MWPQYAQGEDMTAEHVRNLTLVRGDEVARRARKSVLLNSPEQQAAAFVAAAAYSCEWPTHRIRSFLQSQQKANAANKSD